MSEYRLSVPSSANSFQHNGTDYEGGSHYETDNPCDALTFYNNFRSSNPQGGRRDASENFWRNTEAACTAAGGPGAGGTAPPSDGSTPPATEGPPPVGGDSAGNQGAPVVPDTVTGSDPTASPPGTGPDAPSAEEPTAPEDGEAHGTRSGEETSTPTTGGDPVDLFSGTIHLEEADLAIPNTVLPLALVRFYRSGPGFYGPFGWNWDHNHNLFIRELANGDVALWRMSHEERFVSTGSGLEPPRGVFERLDRIGGPGQEYELTAAGGLVFHFARPLNWTDPARTPLAFVRDRHGNTLEYIYDSSDHLARIADEDGNFIALEYDTCNLLVAAQDHSGRRYEYEHDEQTQHLVAVRRPATTDFPAGTTRCYTYPVGAHPPSIRHNLLSISDNYGNTYLENLFEDDPASPSYGRVVAQRYGDYLYQIAYEQLQYAPNDDLFINVPTTQTRVLNPDLSLETYTFNFRGDLLDRRYRLNKDGTYRIAAWQYAYDGQANRIRTVAPDGSEELRVFDHLNADSCMRGALLRTELVAASGFPAPSRIVYRCDYEPRYQLPIREIDESGAARLLRYDFDINPANPANSGRLMEIREPDATLPNGTIQSSVTRFEYNGRGQKTATIQPDGCRIETHYGVTGSEKGKLVAEIVDPGGLAIATLQRYDAAGYECQVVDGNGYITERETNALGLPERLVRPEIGGVTADERYHYNADDKLIMIERPRGAYAGALIDPAGTHIFDTFERDVLGYATNMTLAANSADARKLEYDNDYRGLARRTRMPDGVVIHTSFDERFQPVEERVVGPDGLELRSRNAYDRAGKKVRQIDAEGNVTQYVYDGFGRIRTVVKPNGTEHRLVWGERDLLLSEEVHGDDGTGSTRRLAYTEHAYDERGRRTETRVELFESDPTVATSASTRFFHDANDRIIRIVDPRGAETNREYDFAGRLVLETDPMGNARHHVYDAGGRLVEQRAEHVEPDGSITTLSRRFVWDAHDRLTETIEPDGARTASEYDDRDLIVRQTDREGVVTTSDFDVFGQRVRQVHDVGGLGLVQQWEHDLHSRVTGFTDPTGETSSYSYDSVGRLIRSLFPGGTSSTRSYDAANRLVSETLGSGAELYYAYDSASRIDRITSGAAPAPLEPIATHRFTYDGLNRVVRAQAGTGVVERIYDSSGRLLSETTHGSSIQASYDDAAGRVEKTWPDGRRERLSHDFNGRLAEIEQVAAGSLGEGNGQLAAFAPSGPSALAIARFRGGFTLRNSFDERMRLTEIDLTSPGGLNEHISYRYSTGDHRCVELIEGALPQSRYYGFDKRRRLTLAREGFAAGAGPVSTQAEHNAAILAADAASSSASRVWDYSYDPADARLAESETGNPITNYSYDPGHRLASANGTTYTHGTDGALSSGRGLTYISDVLGRMVRISDGTGTLLEFEYDALGRVRTLRQRGEPERAFHHLGSLVEQESIGGAAVRQMTLNPDTGVPIAYHSAGGTTHFAVVDGRFNLLGLVASDGTLAESYRYAPFGAPQVFDSSGNPIAGSALGSRPIFGGQQYLAGPALYLSRKRLMDPALGQFLSPDPRGYGDSPMLFAYAAQNPVDYIDPSGEIIPFIIGAFVIGGALAGAGYSFYDAYHHPERYEGWRGTARIFGNVFGGAAIGGLAIVGGELVLAAGGTGVFATGAGATTLTASQTFLLYGTSSAVGGTIMRGGFNAMFPDYVDPVTPGSIAFDFVAGGALSVVGRAASPYIRQFGENLWEVGGIARQAIADGTFGTGVREIWRRSIGGNWRMFGNNWRLLRLGYSSASRVRYSLRNLVSDDRTFSAVSSQYWRQSGGANGMALHHWLFQNQNSLIPRALRNAAFNHLEVPGALNTWMGGRLGREWGFRTIVGGILTATGATSYMGTSALVDAANGDGGGSGERGLPGEALAHPNSKPAGSK